MKIVNFNETTQTTLSLLKEVIADNVKRTPNFFKKNWIWLGGLAIIWVPLMTVFPYYLGSFSFVFWLLIFLTAAYNNFVAKLIYISIIHNIVIPVFKMVKNNTIGELLNRIKKLKGVIKSSWTSLGNRAFIYTLMAGGAGLFISNFLTRNNKIDKYLICILIAISLIKAMSDGPGNLVLRFCSAIFRDLSKAFIKGERRITANYSTVYILISSFAAGFVLNIAAKPISAPIRSILSIGGFYDKMTQGGYYDISAYLLGAILMIAGGILSFTFAGKKGKA